MFQVLHAQYSALQRGGTVVPVVYGFHDQGVRGLRHADPPGEALAPSCERPRDVRTRRLLRCSVPSVESPLLPNRVCGELLPSADVSKSVHAKRVD